jgi:hypothetical protein
MFKRVVVICYFVVVQLCEEKFNAFDKSRAMAMVFFFFLLLAKTPPPRSSIVASKKWCLITIGVGVGFFFCFLVLVRKF